jgi:D-lyxose ketol-isomerase
MLLPASFFITLEVWAAKSAEESEIVENDSGFDITDLGKGDFHRFRLVLFTIRNGNPRHWQT